jgi:predicted dehydrogenase
MRGNIMVKFGIIGLGVMGLDAAKSLSNDLYKNGALGAVCDLNAELAEQVGKDLNVPFFTSAEEMLQAVKLDAVYVATPDPHHRKPFIAAADAGVAIIVEKPLATNADDADAMLAAAKRNGVVAQVNFSNRFNPPFLRAKEAIEANEMGELLCFNARLNNAIVSPSKNLAWAGQSTSAWFLLSHCFDLAKWFGDRKAVQVWANGTKRKLAGMGIPTWDYVHAMVKYDDGTDGIFESVWVLPDSIPYLVDFKYQVVGTEGSVWMDTYEQTSQKATADTYSYPRTLAWRVPAWSTFIKRVQDNDNTMKYLEDGVENTKLLVAVHESLESGKVVDIS